LSESQKPIIVTSRALPPLFSQALEQLAEVRVGGEGSSPDVFVGASVYLSAGVDPVSAKLIEEFPESVRLIANIATGTDNIDLEAAAGRGIEVSNTPVVAEDTADLTLALLLATCRRLTFCEGRLREGDWQAGTNQLGTRVHGKTLGIVGLGEIGQAVARRAKAFNMRILYNGPNAKAAVAEELGAEYRSELGDLLAEADVVTLHCPLASSTRHLIDAGRLREMKPGAVLINTGRGALVDEAALVEALEEGRLGGAGLDVFEAEPAITPRLLDLENVTLTPHIGSATGECRFDMAMRALANIKHHLTHGAPLDRVSAYSPAR
jgi:glyoxylate reductase